MFNLMFDQLAQPLTIELPTANSKARDDSGFPVPNNKPKIVHVKEPLVTNTNPSITFNNEAGGQYSTDQLVWQSKAINDAPRGTIVINKHGLKYKVTAIAHHNRFNLTHNYTIYQVKAVNGQ